MKTEGVLYVRNIPAAVKAQFKGACGRRGETMTEVVEALFRLYTERPEIAAKKVDEIRRRKDREKA